MTLAELAALAAKVEGFVLPMGPCEECEAKGRVYRNEFYHLNGGFVPCPSCNGTKVFPSDDPAALLMAVVRAVRKSDRFSRFDVLYGAILCEPCHDTEVEVVSVHGDDNEESIARAALVALLRAHGIEVEP